MKIDYDKESDSLYLQLSERPGLDAEEIEPGIVFDFDRDGTVVGIDIEHASRFVDVRTFEVPKAL